MKKVPRRERAQSEPCTLLVCYLTVRSRNVSDSTSGHLDGPSHSRDPTSKARARQHSNRCFRGNGPSDYRPSVRLRSRRELAVYRRHRRSPRHCSVDKKPALDNALWSHRHCGSAVAVDTLFINSDSAHRHPHTSIRVTVCRFT